MKRLFVLLLSLTFLFVAACGIQESRRKSLTLPLNFTANIKGSDSKFNVYLTETECVISFDEKHPLYGTELVFNSEGGTATIGEYSRNVDLDIFPAQKALINAIQLICQEDISGTEGERQTRYTIDKTLIIVYYDEDNKTPIGIETEEGGRRFQFDIAMP